MFKGEMENLIKRAQQMQEQANRVQEEIIKLEVSGESGAGLVKVHMTGNHNVLSVKIDESIMDDEKEVIEDLIAAAVNDASRRIEEASQEKRSEVTAGIQFPPGFKIPF